MLTELTSCHDEIVDLCVRFRVRSLVAFGSATGDEFDPGRSDVDFLVEFDAPHGMRRIDAYFGLHRSNKRYMYFPYFYWRKLSRRQFSLA